MQGSGADKEDNDVGKDTQTRITGITEINDWLGPDIRCDNGRDFPWDKRYRQEQRG